MSGGLFMAVRMAASTAAAALRLRQAPAPSVMGACTASISQRSTLRPGALHKTKTLLRAMPGIFPDEPIGLGFEIADTRSFIISQFHPFAVIFDRFLRAPVRPTIRVERLCLSYAHLVEVRRLRKRDAGFQKQLGPNLELARKYNRCSTLKLLDVEGVVFYVE